MDSNFTPYFFSLPLYFLFSSIFKTAASSDNGLKYVDR